MDKRRAILFDLDDTLYPYRAFARSGFRAVGRRLADECGLSASLVVRTLRQALVAGERGRELQALCARFALPSTLVPVLAAIMREHTPVLHLPRMSLRVLSTLRESWTIGIVTNGTPDIQRRKIAALGLAPLVDTVVFATEHGDGKPAPSAFRAALDRLGASPGTTVFVGDDERADIRGAALLGLRTIHQLGYRRHACGDHGCGAHVEHIGHVPDVASRLVPMRTEHHAF